MAKAIKNPLLFGILFLLNSFILRAAEGDTVVVQTFTYDSAGSPKKGTFKFPDKDKKFRKILMYYKLRCVSGNNPACGEWDYLTYTHIFKDGVRYELARYITPYGIGLDLGDGWQWVVDVTDYAPLLHDSVTIEAGNWQEQLDLKFVMIEGTPPRDVIDIQNLWVGSPTYDKDIENFLTPMDVKLNATAKMYKLRMRTTGHGFGGNENCSEFCRKEHSFKINGKKEFSDYVWRDNCALNPLYPQGGTWLYSRAGWCPGDMAQTFDYELTPLVTPGSTVKIDYDIEPYDYQGGGSKPYYRIETQLFSYGDPNFNLDASVEDINYPNNHEQKNRNNPACKNAEIEIKNTGKQKLTSLKINYGVKGGQSSTYTWHGNLDFDESEVVVLPGIRYGTPEDKNIFEVSISEPNGGQDEYAYNNTYQTNFDPVEIYNGNVVLWFRTNGAGAETSYKLYNSNGNVLYERSGADNFTLYKDTFKLNGGCYELVFSDSDDDGLSFFANQDGDGSILLFASGKIKGLEKNFGRSLRYSFAIGSPLSVKEIPHFPITVFPNPCHGKFSIDVSALTGKNVEVKMVDQLGKVIYAQEKVIDQPELKFDQQSLKPGIFLIQIKTGRNIVTKKLIIE